MAPLTSADLRAAAWRTLTPQPSLQAALDRMGFLQADPIRAPARAQDLTLLARVPGYRAGELERCYAELDAEEDMIPNYGFVPRAVQALLHPREVAPGRVELEHPGLLEEVRARLNEGKELHPRDLAATLGKGRTVNAWGGQSSATTRILGALHYRGEARVTRRVGGVRVYGPAPHLAVLREGPLPEADRLRRAVHLLAALYSPLPEASLRYLVALSGFGFPHLRGELRAVLKGVIKEELLGAKVDGVAYVWTAEGSPVDSPAPRGVRIVGPFDPLVWDRRRFEHLHGWPYRFEAYTPAAKRTMGYYALPVLHAGRAVGWANLKMGGGELEVDLGFIPSFRQTATFRKGLETELDRYRTFLTAPSDSGDE
ncbi:winged helix DNA-binding domain-containing protein [Deinococcus frigens]|uniref:winged helix DNA-binding domain-containing protein n=1 Tax=Deinococcus frigens TaxID=249403 RepID=UPI0004967F6B|nr:crosslink repair DNA glycosylase YcaQ family protein [Deinococcus frigens]